MKLVELECKNCGGSLKVEEGTDIITCPYCNASYKIDDEVKHVKYEDMENSGYEFEKGRIKAQKEHLSSVAPISTKFIIIPIIAIAIFIIFAVIIGVTFKGSRKTNGFGVSTNQFNLNYNNGRQPGVFVEDDIADIIESNKKYSEKQITVKYEDKETTNPEEIAEIKKSLDLSIHYEITLDYDKDGYICCYTIEKAAKTADEIASEARSFNLFYRSGTSFGSSVGRQLDEVIKSNKTNEERKITVKYEDKETTDPDEI